MPKFYRQNKKKIDPRYFLDETTNRDALNEGPWQQPRERDIAYGAALLARAWEKTGKDSWDAWDLVKKKSPSIYAEAFQDDPNDPSREILTQFGKDIEERARSLGSRWNKDL